MMEVAFALKFVGNQMKEKKNVEKKEKRKNIGKKWKK